VICGESGNCSAISRCLNPFVPFVIMVSAVA
jgi:hypothetical protein